MQNRMLFFMLVSLFIGCETGTRYDENSTIIKLPSKEVVLNNNHHEERSYIEDASIEIMDEGVDFSKEHSRSFSGGTLSNGLDVKRIRKGKHKGYSRLVFDAYNVAEPAYEVGNYSVEYIQEQQKIMVIIQGYRTFSAALPSFSDDFNIEQMYFEEHLDDSAYKFYIKLRENAEVKVFDLKNPARLVFDIKPI